jgi:hypothetical protein
MLKCKEKRKRQAKSHVHNKKTPSKLSFSPIEVAFDEPKKVGKELLCH